MSPKVWGEKDRHSHAWTSFALRVAGRGGGEGVVQMLHPRDMKMDPVEVGEGQDQTWLSTPRYRWHCCLSVGLYHCSKGSLVYIPLDLITNNKKSSGTN
jgi:hypothetical protein